VRWSPSNARGERKANHARVVGTLGGRAGNEDDRGSGLPRKIHVARDTADLDALTAYLRGERPGHIDPQRVGENERGLYARPPRRENAHDEDDNRRPHKEPADGAAHAAANLSEAFDDRGVGETTALAHGL